LDPTVPWVMLTNPHFSDDGPTRIFTERLRKISVSSG
jgi:hypothetical protein